MDNSASRLLRILESAKGHPPTSTCVQVWRGVFEVATDSDVPGRLGLLLCLADQAASEIVAVDQNSRESVTYWQNQILAGFVNCTLHSPWKEFSKFIDKHSLQYLHLQARLLNSSRPTILLDVGALSSARDKLSEALTGVLESDLPSEVRAKIVARIRDLIAAIDDYRITGQDAVFDAFKLAGVDLLDALREQPGFKGSSPLREGLSIVADLMTVAAGGIALTGPVMYLIEHIR